MVLHIVRQAEAEYFNYKGGISLDISTLRKQKRLTQQQLAELTGIKQSRISEYENGSYDIGNMTLCNAVLLAKALGCHAEELLEEPLSE